MNASEVAFAEVLDPMRKVVASTSLDAVDWNADGTLDLVVNGAYQGVSLLLNHRTRPNQVPIASAGTD